MPQDVSVRRIDARATHDGDVRTYQISENPAQHGSAIKRSIEAMTDVTKCILDGNLLKVVIKTGKTPANIDNLVTAAVKQAFRQRR